MTIGPLQIFIFALATACTATAAFAQDQGDDLQGLGAIAVLNGTCKSLVVAGKDLSKDCLGKLLNSIYGSGRTGFGFVTTSGTTVLFSGVDTPARGDQAHSILDRVIFSIDNTEIDPQAVKRDVAQATGTCTYTNPYAGPSFINCSASTKEGSFSASFVSDGNPPEIESY